MFEERSDARSEARPTSEARSEALLQHVTGDILWFWRGAMPEATECNNAIQSCNNAIIQYNNTIMQ